VGAASNAIVSYENLSYLSPEGQDAICTLSTGGGYATRKFYTNGEEHLLETKRPVMLNSISGVATRPDLIERTIRVEAPRIPPSERREESELLKGWNEDCPKILGGLPAVYPQSENHGSFNARRPRPRRGVFVLAGASVRCVQREKALARGSESHEPGARGSIASH